MIDLVLPTLRPYFAYRRVVFITDGSLDEFKSQGKCQNDPKSGINHCSEYWNITSDNISESESQSNDRWEGSNYNDDNCCPYTVQVYVLQLSY